MRLNTLAMALTMGLLWGAVMLIVGLIHYTFPPRGERLLEVIASVYVGYEPDGSLVQVLIGTAYGLVDGALAGAMFGFVYNAFARRFPTKGFTSDSAA